MSIATRTQDRAVILYDSAHTPDIGAQHFDPAWWRGNSSHAGVARGRGAVYFVHAGAEVWALRHYLRGGWMARFTSDVYFAWTLEHTRPWREWRLLRRLRQAGLPVPEPVAARVTRRGPFYRGDLITRVIENVVPLAEYLAGTALASGEWRALGVMVRRFHDAGVRHDDINVRNVLRNAAGELHLIDFDKAAIVPPGAWRQRNLQRLHRSLEKQQAQSERFHFTGRDWQAFLDGYADGQAAAAPTSRAANGSLGALHLY